MTSSHLFGDTPQISQCNRALVEGILDTITTALDPDDHDSQEGSQAQSTLPAR